MFKIDNWNHCQYQNGDNKVILGLGACPKKNDFIYYVTTLDADNNEVFQEDFTCLESACHKANTKYSQYWDFVDLSFTKDSGGCDSCAAH